MAKKPKPGCASRSVSKVISDWKGNIKERQFMLHVLVVCDDDPDDIKHIDDALDTIRDVGSADVYAAEALEENDPRRLRR